MNIIAIKLVLVETKTGSIDMCKRLTVIVAFLNVHMLILLSLAMTHYHSSWFVSRYIAMYLLGVVFVNTCNVTYLKISLLGWRATSSLCSSCRKSWSDKISHWYTKCAYQCYCWGKPINNQNMRKGAQI